MILSYFDLHMFQLNRNSYTFQNVFTIASDVYLFYRFISVIIYCADLFYCFWIYQPTINSSYNGLIFSTRNFLSSWGFFLTFYLRIAIQLMRLLRSLVKRSCSLLVQTFNCYLKDKLRQLTRDGSWRSPTVLPRSCQIQRQYLSTQNITQQLYNYPDINKNQIDTIIPSTSINIFFNLSIDHYDIDYSAILSLSNIYLSRAQIAIRMMIQQESRREEERKFRVTGRSLSLKQPENSTAVCPEPRYKHQSFVYKSKLFVQGGTTIPSSNFSEDTQELYFYDFQKSSELKWQKVRSRCLSKQFETVSGQCGVVNLNRFYMFGGSNSANKQTNLMWRLNLDTFEWNKMQQKGEVPTARQCAFLTYVEKNWLVLYGGVSNSLVEVYNSFHFYNIDTRLWVKCEGAYTYQAYPRLNPAICSHNDKLYMFGGTYRNHQNQEKFLNDFYEFSLNPPSKNPKGSVGIKRLVSNVMPESRAGHNLISLGNKYLVLYGGENESKLAQNMQQDDVSLVENIWLYIIELDTWYQLQFINQPGVYRTMATCNTYQDKLYVFGGLIDYRNVLSDLNSITIDLEQLARHQKRQSPCLKCHEKKYYKKSLLVSSSHLIEQISDNIEFPFAAFGLLVDNSVNCGASHINIYFHESFGSQNVNTIRIEDNSKIKWTDDELVDCLSNYQSGNAFLPHGVDKKIKVTTMKDNQRRQFGMNLKAASLRIGQSCLFVNLSPTEFYYRIILIEKANQGAQNQKYILYFYTYCWYDRNDIHPDMIETRKYVESKYYDYIRDTFSHKYAKNTVFIFNPRINLTQSPEHQPYQMSIYKQHNDIVYGSFSKIKALEAKGYNIFDCVDVSLRAYLTCLYLKNQTVNLSFGIRNNEIDLIQTQVFLQKVDKLCRTKHVLEISSVLQFDLKIIQLFYLYDLKKKLNFFSNGLLIYHKNRLIMRYKYPLGELISRKYYKAENNHNFLRIFGFLELPENIPINVYKTACIYPIMLEKLMTRIKCINKYFKKELHKMSTKPDYKRNAPSKMNEQELQQQQNEIESQDKNDKKKKTSKVRQIKYSQPTTSFRQSKRLSDKMKTQGNNIISDEKEGNLENGSYSINNDNENKLKSQENKSNENNKSKSDEMQGQIKWSNNNDNVVQNNQMESLKEKSINQLSEQNVQQKLLISVEERQMQQDEIFQELKQDNQENMKYSSQKIEFQDQEKQPLLVNELFEEELQLKEELLLINIQGKDEQSIQKDSESQQEFQQMIIQEKRELSDQHNQQNNIDEQQNQIWQVINYNKNDDQMIMENNNNNVDQIQQQNIEQQQLIPNKDQIISQQLRHQQQILQQKEDENGQNNDSEINKQI